MGGCGGWTQQETVTGQPNYRLQTAPHTSDWTDSITTMSYSSLLSHTHTHTHSHDAVLTLSTTTFPQASVDGSSVWPRLSGWNEALDILAQIKASEQTQEEGEGQGPAPCTVCSGGPPSTQQCSQQTTC